MHTALSNTEYNSSYGGGPVGLDLLPGLGHDCLPRLGQARLATRAWELGMVGAVHQLDGCIFFGVSAIAAYVVPSSGSMIDLAAVNWNTSLGAACFLACALATLLTGHTSKSPRRRRLQELEHAVERAVDASPSPPRVATDVAGAIA